MELRFKKIIFSLLFLLQIFFAAAQVKFSATANPASVNRDEYITVRFVIENANDISQLNPPSFNKFIVVSGPNQESGMSSVNGSVTQYAAVSYILQPKSPGQFVIDGATAIVSNHLIKSNLVKIFVKNGLSGTGSRSATRGAGLTDPFASATPTQDFTDYILKDGESVQDKVAKNMQLKLQTDKTSCYVGEPIVASYKLYTRLKSESSLAKNPSFNGFSVIDLSQPDASDYKRETLNGREYNVYNIRKAQLYPLQAGNIELETAVLDNNIQFLKDGTSAASGNIRDMLNGFTMNGETVSETVSLSSKPLTITVKPLPEEGKPLNYKGAVGNFTIEAETVKNNFSTDETGTLAVRISGNGNLQLVTSPEITWPGGLESFDPKATDNTVTTTVPVSGNKVFVYSFTADHAGNYVIPTIKFSFFDPVSGKYKSIETKPIDLTVSKGAAVPVFPATKGFI